MQHTHSATPADAVNIGATAQMRMGAEQPQRRTINLSEMIAATARLAQILAEEVDCLDEMRITDIEKLQDEKRRLTKGLEIMKREVERNPEIAKTFAAEDVAAFHEVSKIFDEVLQENHRKLLVAKEINFRVVQAISDVVKEESQRIGYTQRGKQPSARDTAASISLNKTI